MIANEKHKTDNVSCNKVKSEVELKKQKRVHLTCNQIQWRKGAI